MFNKWPLKDLMGAWPYSVTVGDRPRVGELAAFSVEQDVQTWLQDASLWSAVVANTNELPHVTRRLLCGQWMTRHGTGRALKGHFRATVMFQISLQRRAFSHE